MSEREDQKLRDVVVAQYPYRHDAEFAAGFLEDAGIPYRLQIDDPSMGLTISAPAALWVRGMDLKRAQEILDVGNRPTLSRPADGRFATSTARRRSGHPARRSPAPYGVGDLSGPELGMRERVLALAGSVGIMSLGPLVFRGVSDGAMVGTAVIAAGLFLVALFGRAPQSLRRLLRALSGSAP